MADHRDPRQTANQDPQLSSALVILPRWQLLAMEGAAAQGLLHAVLIGSLGRLFEDEDAGGTLGHDQLDGVEPASFQQPGGEQQQVRHLIEHYAERLVRRAQLGDDLDVGFALDQPAELVAALH